MAERSADSRVMGGVWVFPGGTVDGGDDETVGVVAAPDDDRRWRAAALRELVEELGIWITTDGVHTERVAGTVYAAAEAAGVVLDGDALGYFANWITPEPLPVRFDTRFYAAVAEAEPDVDGVELVAAHWIQPQRALRLAEDGEWSVAFPTVKTLSLLARFPDAAAAMSHITSLVEVPPVQPKLVVTGGRIDVLLPGDPGFDKAASDGAELRDRVVALIRDGRAR